MGPDEVYGILVEEMSSKDSLEAFASAPLTISLKMLEKFRDKVDSVAWIMLTETAKAKNKVMRLINFVSNGTFIDSDAEILGTVLYLHEHWLKVLEYMHANYATLSQGENFKKSWDEDTLKQLKEMVSKDYAEMKSQIESLKLLSFEIINLDIMFQTFLWMQYGILGHEASSEYVTEYNQAMAALREYYMQLNGSDDEDTSELEEPEESN